MAVEKPWFELGGPFLSFFAGFRKQSSGLVGPPFGLTAQVYVQVVLG